MIEKEIEERIIEDILNYIKVGGNDAQTIMDNISSAMEIHYEQREKLFMERMMDLVNKSYLSTRQIIYCLNNMIFIQLHNQSESEQKFSDYKLEKKFQCPRCGGRLEDIIKETPKPEGVKIEFIGMKCPRCDYKEEFFDEE